MTWQACCMDCRWQVEAADDADALDHARSHARDTPTHCATVVDQTGTVSLCVAGESNDFNPKRPPFHGRPRAGRES